MNTPQLAAPKSRRPVSGSWQHVLRPDVCAAMAVGVVGFGLRFLASRGFSNDHFMHLAWSQQLLAGEVPGRDFIDPGMPLTYVLSALGQAISPGPYGELVLTAAALGLAAALVCVVVRQVTGQIALGVIAGLFSIALQPRLYSYPKILVPAITLAAVSLYVSQPSRRRAALLGAWTVLAALLRYDLGLYTGAAMAAALLAVHWREPRRLAGAVGVYGLAVGLAGAPYAAFVQWATGLRVHLEEAVEFARSDQHQLMTLWSNPPDLPSVSPATWSGEESAAFLFFVCYGVAVATLLLLAARRHHQPGGRAPVVLAGAVLMACYAAFVLRHDLVARIPDVAAVLAVMGTWSLFELGRTVRAGFSRLGTPWAVGSTASAAVVLLVLFPALTGVWRLSNIREGIDATAVTKGWAKMAERATVVRQNGTEWPWEREWPSGKMPAVVHYLDQCTQPSDHLLLTWPAPEYYYFARRQFAAGHALLLPPRAFTAEAHQRRMIARLETEFVPIVLINETAKEEFARSYGLLAEYVADRYVAIGNYTIYDDSVITVARRRDLRGSSTYGPEQWPCGLVPTTAALNPAGVAGNESVRAPQ